MNVMLVKTNKLEFLAVDQDSFLGDSTKCFVLFRAKGSMQPAVLNFQTNVRVKLLLAFQ